MDSPRAHFAEDTVRPWGKTECGVVMRSWNDLHEDDLLMSGHPFNPPPLPLRMGQVEYLTRYGQPEIVESRSLELLDRSFLPGDIARDPKTGLIGLIKQSNVEVQLQTVISNQTLPGWHDLDKLQSEHRLSRGDAVAAENWVGIVEEIFQEALVEGLNGGGNIRLCDVDSGLLSVGLTAKVRFCLSLCPEAVILIRVSHGLCRPSKIELVSFFSPSTVEFPDLEFEQVVVSRVIHISQTAVAINWLAINQTLPITEQDLPRPKRYWTDLDKLIQVTHTSHQAASVGDKFMFRLLADEEVAVAHLPGSGLSPQDKFMAIINRRSNVTVIWMDGSETNVNSIELEQSDNLDAEHDAWPGDPAVYNADGERKVAIVLTADPLNRVTTVKWWGTEETAVVSTLELDPVGASPEVFGVKRGDIVLVSSRPTHARFPDVPRIGESEANYPGPDALRDQLQDIGYKWANSNSTPRTLYPNVGPTALGRADWIGTVIDLTIDAQVVIKLPSYQIMTVPHDRVFVFLDHRDHGAPPDDMEDDEMDMDDVSESSSNSGAAYGSHPDGDEGKLRVEEKGWAESDDEDGGNDEAMEVDNDSGPATKPKATRSILFSTACTVVRFWEVNGAPMAGASDSGTAIPTTVPVHNNNLTSETPWKPFVILEEAPVSHHYYSENVTTPPRTFMSRLRKEYAVMESSLPENVIVRAYEDRTDLLRACIIGSVDTPYEDSCFVFDIYLSPDKFPQEPPQVFFLSWTNGGGRIQPNLYENGKVCLSILGTWAGDSTESWSSARSSILQVLISISGLCLVKDPYYNEPGYEKTKGTVSGRVASNLYSERAFVLTRGFVKHALSHTIPSLDTELKWYYLSGPPSGKGKLPSIVAKMKAMLEESERVVSEGKGADDAAASGVLTVGGAIPLRRVAAALDEILEKHKRSIGGMLGA